ncbi:MAG: 2-oxo acid dehydrogenase subunit E2 [Planctomycetota bacterium]
MDNPAKIPIAPLTRIQKLIGKRMLKSKQTKPCFYIESKADVTELMGLRPKLKKSLGVKITTNAFYIRALAMAVKKYPLTVGTIDGDNIRIADAINVGFAVDAPQGLVVPVIKGAYGIDSFFGIVPPPTSTILAVGNVIKEALPKEGKAIVRKKVSLTLAVDRRIIDEVYAAKFLNFIKEQLQNPQQLV